MTGSMTSNACYHEVFTPTARVPETLERFENLDNNGA